MWRQARLPILLILSDLGLVFISLWLSDLLRPHLPFGKSLPVPQGWPAPLWILVPIMCCAVLAFTRNYDIRANLKTSEVFLHLLGGSALFLLVLSGFLFLTYRETSRWQVKLFVLMLLAVLFLERVLVRWMLRHRFLQTLTQRRILIVGCNPLGQQLASTIDKLRWLGLHLAGYVDDELQPGFESLWLGRVDQISRIVQSHRIDEVILALPFSSSDRMEHVVRELQMETDATVRMAPDVIPLAFLRIHLDDVSGIPLISLREPILTPYERMIKRYFDLTVAGTALILLSPLLALIALLIKLESRGPVLFVQHRIGEGGRPFRMYKFRTMQHKPEVPCETPKIPNDPRITRVGKLLRRASLDEIPQFYNVFVGNMSLVGPRPEIPSRVQNYEPWQRKRFAVPQGLTGWWQVNGRSDKPMHLNTEEDLFYIRNYSFWFDLWIIGKTLKAVLQGKGAY